MNTPTLATLALNGAQRILPVDPPPPRVGRLAVGQVLHELQHHRQREPTRGRGGLAAAREEGGELVVPVDRAERVSDAQAERALAERAFGKRRSRDAAGLVGHRRRGLPAPRHRSAAGRAGPHHRPTRPDTPSRARDRPAADFATSVKVGPVPTSGSGSAGDCSGSDADRLVPSQALSVRRACLTAPIATACCTSMWASSGLLGSSQTLTSPELHES